MCFGGLDILDVIGIFPRTDKIKDLRVCHSGTGNVNMNWKGCYWDACDIGFSLIADFLKFEQFHSRFEMGIKLAIFTR